jgi:two-component system sensor histidine kinase DctS
VVDGPAARQARVDALAVALAHELRNPLSTITMTLELLREELAARGGREPDAIRKVDAALDELKRVDRTFGDFLRYVREPAPHLQPADVNRLVEESLAAVTPELRAKRLTPVLQLDRRAGPVPVDAALFRQALVCLLQNVIGTLEGGTVTVQTRMTEGRLELHLIDTGPGPPSDVAARMFDSYFTAVSGKSGVGLGLARQIVELHSGRIGYEQAPGSGNRYAIVLPVPGAR